MSAAEELAAALGRDTPVDNSAAGAACQVAERIVYQSIEGGVPPIGSNGARGSGKSTPARLVAGLPPHEGPIDALERAGDPEGARFRWSLEPFGRYTRAKWASLPGRADMPLRRNGDFAFAPIKE